MPQYRQDFITKEWVIISPERAKRPDQFTRKDEKKVLAEHDEKCPFCLGNENQTPEPVLVAGDKKDWKIRVVPNKFAAVNPTVNPERQNEGKFLMIDGFGMAEVVIETPRHNTNIALLSENEVLGVLSAYKERFAKLSSDDRIDVVTIFRNHGLAAGTSLEHPHSQIIATPIVTPYVRQLMQQSLIYHDTYGGCPYCVMLEEEMSQDRRVILESKHFVAFCPYASRVPFEIRIIPKRHYSRYDGITNEELMDLAYNVRTVLRKLYFGLKDPDYNFIIRTSPTSDGELHYDHWRFLITPRITTPAGFEIGSGIYINSMPPENAAEFLRGISV